MGTFKTWEEARADAEAGARAMGIAHGIERSGYDKQWRVRLLPKKENRYGVDARCEAVEPW